MIFYNQLTIFKMNELLEDPDTIEFVEDSKINLHFLKNEIDRRFLKLSSMILGFESQKYQKEGICSATNINIKSNKNVQTDEDNCTPSNSVLTCLEKSNVLLPSKGNLPPYKSSKKSLQKKSQKSLKRQNKQNANKQSKKKNQKSSSIKNSKTKLGEYLIECKNDIQIPLSQVNSGNNSKNDSSQQKAKIRASIDQKYFSSVENLLLFSSVKQSIKNDNLDRFGIRNIKNHRKQSFQQVCSISSFSDHSDKHVQYNNHRRKTSRIPSHNKYRSNIQRPSLQPESEKRVIVSQQCKQKMLQEINNNMNSKRREPRENQLRNNILKKIENKYKNSFDKM